MIELKKNEILDDLELDGLKIIQNREGYMFTSDAVVLSNFVFAKNSDKCAEIGSGNGVISILVEHKNKPQKIYSFEIQKSLAEMSKRSVEYNNKQDTIEIINGKVQNFEKYIDKNSIDVVFSNPPYRKNNSLKGENKERNICCFEETITLKELCSIAYNMLKDKGKFYIVYDATRSAELIYELSNSKLEPKRMFYTAPSIEKSPVLILVEAVKNGKQGVKVLPQLITNDKDGKYINKLQTNYKKG